MICQVCLIHFSTIFPPFTVCSLWHYGHQSSCDSVLTVCRIHHLLQLQDVPFQNTHSHTHITTSHNTNNFPDLISSVWFSEELMAVKAHFSTDTVHPCSCLIWGFTLSLVLTYVNIKQRQRQQKKKKKREEHCKWQGKWACWDHPFFLCKCEFEFQWHIIVSQR